MNTVIDTASLDAVGVEAKETRADRTIRLLMQLDGDPKRQKRTEFVQFYPAVLQALRRKSPRKAIIKLLSDGGLKLYPALFEEFLSDMQRGTIDCAPIVQCSHCGQALPTTEPVDPECNQSVLEGSCKLNEGDQEGRTQTEGAP